MGFREPSADCFLLLQHKQSNRLKKERKQQSKKKKRKLNFYPMKCNVVNLSVWIQYSEVVPNPIFPATRRETLSSCRCASIPCSRTRRDCFWLYIQPPAGTCRMRGRRVCSWSVRSAWCHRGQPPFISQGHDNVRVVAEVSKLTD